ncbi:MAG: G1 family glutamic endopeptidase [Ktedonobacteraceae bacterium]
MKKSVQSFRGSLVVFAILLGLTSFPIYAQQLPHLKSSLVQRVSVPAAKDLARRKAAQSRQARSIHKLTSYVDSSNWAGYVAGNGSGNGFIGVEANWSGPCKSGTVNGEIQYTTWVGLGGYFSGQNLEQAGLFLQTDGAYRMFWEYAPVYYPYIDTKDVIGCGDPITAWVHFGHAYLFEWRLLRACPG